jgi:hypothetical protein
VHQSIDHTFFYHKKYVIIITSAFHVWKVFRIPRLESIALRPARSYARAFSPKNLSSSGVRAPAETLKIDHGRN